MQPDQHVLHRKLRREQSRPRSAIADHQRALVQMEHHEKLPAEQDFELGPPAQELDE